jgi:uncharacterized protein (TIGR00251 family)
MTLRMQADDNDVLLWVKAVPGASRDEITGLVGDRLKVRITAAAQSGQANKAICKLLAKMLGIKPRQVTIESGQTNPEKIVRLQSIDPATVQHRLDAIE